MNCYAYNPNVFAHVEGEDWSRWRSLYKFINYAVSFVDRTGSIQTPVDTGVPEHLVMPAYDPDFALSYQDCCHAKVKSMLELQDKLGVPIRIMYSGGIDSSLILSSFVDVIGVDESARRIQLLMDQESIQENPWMWERVIRKNFTVLDSDKHGVYYNSDNILVAGEGNDQLLGTDLYRDLVRWGGDGILDQRWSEANIKLYLASKDLSAEEQNMWFDLFTNQMKNTACPIDTIGDFWWWINFSCKWTSVYYRMMFYTQSPNDVNDSYLANYYQQFFNTQEFQLWSLKDRTHKHQGNYISYKFHARELVAKTIDAPEYLSKIKKPSLSNVTRFKHACDVIDSNHKFHYGIKPLQWYNPNNSFL